MMLIKGIENVASVETKTTTGGKEYAIITSDNGLRFTTWSSTVTSEAIAAHEAGVALAFWGKVKAREYQGKFYPDFDIETAQAMTLEKIATEQTKAEGLPF